MEPCETVSTAILVFLGIHSIRHALHNVNFIYAR